MTTLTARTVAEILGVPEPGKTGRDRLVAAAIELFYRRGFGAVGIDQVIEKAGVTKTTFYKHFESKDDLMVAAVQRRDEWESVAWDREIRKIAGDDPAGQLLAFLDVIDVWFNDPEFHGCMFMNTAAEFPTRTTRCTKPPRRSAKKDATTAATSRSAQGATKSGIETFADCYTALIESALVLRQTHGRNDAARSIRPAVEQLIVAYLPNASTAKPRKRAEA